MSNMIDITEMTDAAINAFLDAKAGLDVSADHLTVPERVSVGKALGWDMDSAGVRYWLYN